MWVWLVVALIAAAGEVLTTGLFLVIVAVAAVIVAILALVLPLVVQLAVFASVSLAGIVFIRPALIRSFGIDSLAHASGHSVQSQIVGRRATVTRTVDSAGGQVRIGDGEFWSARSYDPDDLIPVGAPAEIMVVDGLTALVSPVVPLTLEDDAQLRLQADTQVPTQKGA